MSGSCFLCASSQALNHEKIETGKNQRRSVVQSPVWSTFRFKVRASGPGLVDGDAPEQRFHSFSGQCVPVLTNCCYLPNEFPAHTSAWACSITSAELCICSCWISWDSYWPAPLAWPRYFLSGRPSVELSTGAFNVVSSADFQRTYTHEPEYVIWIIQRGSLFCFKTKCF